MSRPRRQVVILSDLPERTAQLRFILELRHNIQCSTATDQPAELLIVILGSLDEPTEAIAFANRYPDMPVLLIRTRAFVFNLAPERIHANVTLTKPQQYQVSDAVRSLLVRKRGPKGVSFTGIRVSA